NFDNADTSGLGHAADGRPEQWYAPAEKVLPGWRLYFGSDIWTVINVNEVPDFTANYATLGDRQEFGDPVDVTTGTPWYALALNQATKDSPPWNLEQTGTIPGDTSFLTYRSYGDSLEV